MTTPTQQATPPPQTLQKSQLLSPEEVVRIVWSKHDQAEKQLRDRIPQNPASDQDRMEKDYIEKVISIANVRIYNRDTIQKRYEERLRDLGSEEKKGEDKKEDKASSQWDFLPAMFLGLALGVIIARIARVSWIYHGLVNVPPQHQFNLTLWMGIACAMSFYFIYVIAVKQWTNTQTANKRVSCHNSYTTQISSELCSLYKEVNQAHNDIFGQLYEEDENRDSIRITYHLLKEIRYLP